MPETISPRSNRSVVAVLLASFMLGPFVVFFGDAHHAWALGPTLLGVAVAIWDAARGQNRLLGAVILGITASVLACLGAGVALLILFAGCHGCMD